MPGRFLIDLTDDRFKTAQNRDVVEYIRRMNPFAHSDAADRLIRSADGLQGASVYCPAPANCAYVVLHTARDLIFGIAYGQRGLAFRLPESVVADAVGDGGALDAAIGGEWVAFHPWPVAAPMAVTQERLKRWCAVAYRHAASGR